MAEVLVNYEGTVKRTDSPAYVVRACGRPLRENLWEGWLEFVPDDGSAVLRSQRETTQPNREDLEYWATGLEMVYLEGALERALLPEPEAAIVEVTARPAYDEPAPHQPHAHAAPTAALDPFRIQASQGDEVLSQQLDALDDWQLRNVVIAHEIEDERTAETLDRQSLIRAILDTVRA